MPVSASGLRTLEGARGCASGPDVERRAAVIGVAAVGDVVEAALARECGEPAIQLVFAVEAAIALVGAIRRILELARRDHFVADADARRERTRRIELTAGDGRRVGGDGESVSTELRVRDRGDERAVHAA